MKAKLRALLVLTATGLMAGCTDSMESLSREFRNANNEGVDAMMMVTDEPTAARMTIRIFKPLQNRYKDVEERMKYWEANRTKKEKVEETFGSNGFYLYLAELEVNKMRFSMEKSRLRSLYNQYQEIELKKLRDEGDPDPVITNPREVCPALFELVEGQGLDHLLAQLNSPKVKQLMSDFPNYKLDTYAAEFQKFEEKRKLFGNTPPPQLVW